MVKFASAFLVYIVLFCTLAPSVSAQQAATATLSGRITEQTGAVIAGALVTATQKATGLKRQTTSTEDGWFVLTNLPADEYVVSIQSSGFSVKDLTVTLLVGQDATLDTTLNIAGVAVGVDRFMGDSLAAVSMESSAVDGVIAKREIENLPLNGRNFLELALLIPGNAPAPNFDPTKTNTVVISSAGQLGRGGNVTVDGADDNDDVVGGQLQNISQEAVQEFQIATNRFSAQLGRSASAVINIVTKSGSNEYHGSGSYYFRNRNSKDCLPPSTAPASKRRHSIVNSMPSLWEARSNGTRPGSLAPLNFAIRMAPHWLDRETCPAAQLEEISLRRRSTIC